MTYWARLNDWLTLRAISIREFLLKWTEEQQEQFDELVNRVKQGRDN